MSATQLIMLGEGAGGGPVTYIEDVFSTYLYAGNGSTQTITNSIDLSTKGGLVWLKQRNAAGQNTLFDTARGAYQRLRSDTTEAQVNISPNGLTSFNSSGFSLSGTSSDYNGSSDTYASWTFCKQPKFFDIQTWTGTGANRTISHDLGSAPGCIIIKRTDIAMEWIVWHIGLTSAVYTIYLNYDQQESATNLFRGVTPSSTSFSITGGNEVNASGGTYVAYLFAHDAGGFGATGADNVISCGSYVGNGNGSAGPITTLGYEPQWVMVKNRTAAGNWAMFDNMRAMTAGGNTSILNANLSGAETTGTPIAPLSNGFQILSTNTNYNASGNTYIYIAIRRGPMKVPTTGASVFQPVAYTGTNVDNRLVNSGIVTDMTMARIRTATSTGGFYTADRLRGNLFLGTAVTAAEATDADSFMTPTVGYGNSFSAMNGFGVGNDATRQLNQSSTSQLAYAFQRAPSFFDEVCYTGDGNSSQTLSHNLGATPQLILIKARNSVYDWVCYSATTGTSNTLYLNLTNASTAYTIVTSPTSTTFTANNVANNVTDIYVAYLFATCAGVSKVGSYTGTGATLNIDCGFTSGARFVLIKRTDATGDWWVWDTARGMVAGTDPRIRVNLTSVETNANWVYTTTGGFQIVTTATDVNASGGTYIFLAIA